MRIFFVTDPLTSPIGAVKPALLLAKELRQFGYDVLLVSPNISGEVVKLTAENNIPVQSLNANYCFTQTPPIFEAWLRSLFERETHLSLDYANAEVLINTSSCMKIKSDIYYAQGLMITALQDMYAELPLRYKYAYHLSVPVFKCLERQNIKQIRSLSRSFIANSKFCASMYTKRGVYVNGIIYPPLDCTLFKPTTEKPSADYVLTYFGVMGKETKFPVTKRMADAGLKIKAFGCKADWVPAEIAEHRNIDFLGKVTDKELADLYSNALFTLFTFTHEPFGYIPVESMACGTPVLTYNRQGPSESVADGITGWLAENDQQLLNLGLRFWKHGYPRQIRQQCRRQSSFCDSRSIAKKWSEVITRFSKQPHKA